MPVTSARADSDADAVRTALGETVRRARTRLATASLPQLDRALHEVLATVGRVLGAACASIHLLDGDALAVTHRWQEADASCSEGTVDVDSLQELFPQLRRGTAVHSFDIERDPAWAALAAPGSRSMLVMPMLSFGELLGLVRLCSEHPRQFAEVPWSLLGQVADLFAAAWVRREARSSIGRAQARLEELLRHVDDVLVTLDPAGRCTWASQSLTALGMEPSQIRGVRVRDLLVDADNAAVLEQFVDWRAGDTSEPLELPEMQLVTPLGIRSVQGSLRDLRHVPGVEGDLLTFRDVTELRHTLDTSRRNAMLDTLTRLPNRTSLREHLGDRLDRPSSTGAVVGLLFLDLDRFKLINDTRGHLVGDLLLRQAAERLATLARPHEFVARFGGDEFVVVLQDGTADQVHEAAARFGRALATPFYLDGEVEEVTASMGLRLCATEEPHDVDMVLRDADTALFVAKERGRDRLAIFDPDMAVVAARRSALMGRLREAIEQGAVVPAFQPIVDLRTGRTVGVEALARWTDPQLGIVSPVEFIPVAEETGLVQQLGLQVLSSSAATFAGWPTPLTVSVNVSARQLEEPDLAAQITAMLRCGGLPAERVRLEVTESSLMRDPEGAKATLRMLRSLGMTIALDDFGTGHSSLAILRDLPLDVLKIDRAFIATSHTDQTNRAMVRTIVTMARHFGLTTVAEGVELPAHAEFLLEAGCDHSQGWLHGRAMSPEQLAAHLGVESVAQRAQGI